MNDRQPLGEPVPIPLARLIPNPDYQPRAGGLSEPHLRLLLESDPATWPPLLVSPTDADNFDILDGFHRHEAARRVGLPAVSCVVAPGAGYPEAVAANLRHGLPLSMADRKDAARWWAEHVPGLSYREIGRRVGLSDKTAKAAIEAPERAENPRPRADPIRRLVGLTVDAYQGGHGRRFLGMGKEADAGAFRRRIEEYDDDERPKVARALAAFGRAIAAAAEPYLSDR